MSDKAKTDNRTHAQKRKAEFQEAIRERIQATQLINQIYSDLDREILPDELNTVKFKTETRFKLLNKVLPDLKSTEVTGDDGNPVNVIHRLERIIVDPSA